MQNKCFSLLLDEHSSPLIEIVIETYTRSRKAVVYSAMHNNIVAAIVLNQVQTHEHTSRKPNQI